METLNKISINPSISKDSSLSGSKFPVTVVQIIVRDKRDKSIIYQDTEVIAGHNLDPGKIEEVRNTMKLKYLAEKTKGIPHEQLRRIFGK